MIKKNKPHAVFYMRDIKIRHIVGNTGINNNGIVTAVNQLIYYDFFTLYIGIGFMN